MIKNKISCFVIIFLLHFLVSNHLSAEKLGDLTRQSPISKSVTLKGKIGKNHYFEYGKIEGRTLDDFDEWGYLASNNDLIKVFGSNTTDAIKHYISFGKSEGRLTDLFNAESYLNNYSDLKKAFGNDYASAKKHFVEYGFNEGRFYT